MRGQEANDTLRLGIELVMFGVLCVLVVFLTTISRNMYSLQEQQEAVQEYMKEQSENYFINYAEHIYGADIVEFIIKYDETYDYYITLKDGSDFTITKEYALELKDEGKDSDILWSQEFLTNNVLGNAVYSEFTVNAVKNVYSIDYYISEK